MVVSGWRWAVDSLTKCPVMVDRFTVVSFDVPRPTFSVEVVLGLRRAVEALTKRPVEALLLTVRPMMGPPIGAVAHLEHNALGALGLGSLASTRPVALSYPTLGSPRASVLLGRV
jgi:hypothetical protein